MQLTKNKKGQSLVELLLAMGLMAVFLPALLTGFVASREAKPQKEKRYAATMLLREAEEAARSVWEVSWDNIITNGTYHPEISIVNDWSLVSGVENTSEGFERSIVISDVRRDVSGNIVASGGFLDPTTKRLDVRVTWQEPIQGEIESIMYLTRYQGNTTWTQDTEVEFSEGFNTNVSIVNNDDGEVELTESTGGTWLSPTIVDRYDSPNQTDGYTVYSVGNYLFLGSDEFEILNISNPLNITLVGSTTVGSSAIYDIYVSGNYAYLATNDAEFTVVDISDKSSPTVADTLDLAQPNDGYAVFKSGNYAFLGRDATAAGQGEFYSIDVTDPTNVAISDSLEYGADVNAVFVSGNYAYLATDGNELEVVDVSDPTNLVSVANYNTPTNFNGEDVFVLGNYAYLLTSNDGGGPEFFVIDISNPLSPSLLGSTNIGGNANGVWVVGDYAFIANESPPTEFQVIDVSDKNNPTTYGTTAINKASYDVVINGNYAYLAVADQDGELVIIEGGFGPGGLDYQTEGTYESQTFDAGAEVAFNHIGITATEPIDTNIKMQVATNDDNATWNFVGPDGTNSTYFDNEGGFPFDYILGRYARFKAYLTGDGFGTPILEDVTINYTP